MQMKWEKQGEDGDEDQPVHGLNLLKRVLVKETKPPNVMGYVWHTPSMPNV